MPKVSVIAKVTAKQGMRDDLLATLQFALDHVAEESGTLLFLVHADAVDADVVWFYEMYRDQEALTVHGTGNWMTEWAVLIRPFTAKRPELTFLTGVVGKGAD